MKPTDIVGYRLWRDSHDGPKMIEIVGHRLRRDNGTRPQVMQERMVDSGFSAPVRLTEASPTRDGTYGYRGLLPLV